MANGFEFLKEALENTERELYNEMLVKEQMQEAVLVCNFDNKSKLKQIFPDACILGTKCCDDKIYMITDKDLIERLRHYLRYDTRYFAEEDFNGNT